MATPGGQIGGLLTVRDQDIPQVQSSLDTLAYDLGSAVNAANEAGSDTNGNAGVAIFNLPSSSSWSGGGDLGGHYQPVADRGGGRGPGLVG